MKLTINIKNSILYLVLLSMVPPAINFFGFTMPVVYLLTPIGTLILLCVLFDWFKSPPITKMLIVIWLVVLIQILVTTFYSTVGRLDYFIFPTDIIQYVVRFIFLISFIVLAYRGQIDKDIFIKYFLLVLILGMSIGILQWIPWPGREFLIRLYPYKDGSTQIEQLSRPLYAIRMHGFPQHATANGGIASFAFVYAYSIRKYYSKYNKLCLVLLIFSIINIIASQARAGMLAVVCSIILLYFVNVKYEKKSLKPTAYFAGIVALLCSIFIYLYNKGNEFIVRNYNRWVNLFESGGGARLNKQPQYFFSLMRGADYFFGLSKPIINRSEITYGVEVEPINIFVTYGIAGFLLQYFLVLFLLVYFFRKINKSTQNKAVLALCIASFVGLFGYQVFSVGYYFFREIRVGLFPWILMGTTIGLYERYKKNKHIEGDGLNAKY